MKKEKKRSVDKGFPLSFCELLQFVAIKVIGQDERESFKDKNIFFCYKKCSATENATENVVFHLKLKRKEIVTTGKPRNIKSG